MDELEEIVRTEEGAVSLDERPSYWDHLQYFDEDHGIIRLYNDISELTMASTLQRLDVMEKNKIKKITLKICSPGGGAYYAFAIYDRLVQLVDAGIEIEGVVEGWAASAASMIVLQGCSHRASNARSRFLLHEARRWVMLAVEKTSDLEDEVKEMKALTDVIVQIISQRSGKSADEVRQTVERREVWMSAQEALDWGLIDQVI
jgi:ATP-dependent Clp protease, protease subunit